LNYTKRASLAEIVSRLAAVDKIPINTITTSSFIRESMYERGYKLPKNHSDVLKLIKEFYGTQKTQLIESFKKLKADCKKFSLTMDEWTSCRNRQYLNINVHHFDNSFDNLGLVRINDSCTAMKIYELTER
jgi:hypothetical protein